MSERITESRLKSIIQTCLRDNLKLERRYFEDENAKDNFESDFAPMLSACQKWNKEEELVGYRGTAITFLRRFSTGHDGSPGGHYSIHNLAVFRSSVPVLENSVKVRKDIGVKNFSSKKDQPVLAVWARGDQPEEHQDYFDDVPRPDFKSDLVEVTKERAYELFPELERYELPNGKKVDLAGFCEFHNYPGGLTAEYKNKGMDLHEAGTKALEEMGNTMVTLGDEEMSIKDAAEKLHQRFPQHTRLELMNLIKDGPEDWKSTERGLEIASGARESVWVWTMKDGELVDKTKYLSSDIAAAKLGLCYQTVRNKVRSGKPTRQNQYITDTDNPPTALQNNVTVTSNNQISGPYVQEIVDTIIIPELTPDLGANEKAAVYYKLGKATLKEVMEFRNLTENQVKLYAAKALNDMKRNVSIKNQPNDPKEFSTTEQSSTNSNGELKEDLSGISQQQKEAASTAHKVQESNDPSSGRQNAKARTSNGRDGQLFD